MNWTYNGKTITSLDDFHSFVGFVYVITNIQSGKGYIGKKLFRFKKTKQVKGKKKRLLVESDWQSYWSSCDELKEDVKRLGPENFTREMIHLCANKGTLNYLELREQIDRRVLESNNWYNGFVGSKIHKKHVRL